MRIAQRESALIAPRTPARLGVKPTIKHLRQRYVLAGIPLIGAKRADALLVRFGSLRNVLAASKEELMDVPMIGVGQAEAIFELANAEYPKVGHL